MDNGTTAETQLPDTNEEEALLLERGNKLRSFFAGADKGSAGAVYTSEDRVRYFRISAHSLLVHEDAWGGFLDKYAEWLAHDSGKGIDVIRSRIKNIVYGPAPVVTEYIFEGKTPVPVISVKARFDNPRALNILLYNGTPVPASTHIHPKDPLLAALPFLSAYDGTTFTFRWKGSQELTIASGVFSRLRGYLDLVPGVAEEFPAALLSNRELLRRFDIVLKMLRPAKSHLPLFIPARYGRQGAYVFLMLGKVMLVEEKAAIIDVYSTRGRFSEQFFRDEYMELVARPPRKPLKEGGKGLHLVKGMEGGKTVLGRIDTFHKQALVMPRVINDCVGFLLSTATKHSLPKRFTLLDVLLDLKDRLGKAAPVRDADVPRELREKVQKGSWVARNGKWYFVLDSKGVIRNVLCQERRASPSSERGRREKPQDRNSQKGPVKSGHKERS